MASGDSLFVLDALGPWVPPSSNPATPDLLTETSTPNAYLPVLDFDGATNEHMDWHISIPEHYGGGGFTFEVQAGVDGADVDIVEFEIRMIDIEDATDVTADLGIDLQTAVTLTDTPPATPADKMNIWATGNLSHANAGSPAAGANVIVRVTRDVSVATNTDDLQLLRIHATET